MNNAAKKALEKEWTAQQNQLLKERTATEEAVKSELVAALKERLKELKREEAESRKGLPLAQRIARITGYNMADNWYEQANAKHAIKDLTREDKNGSFSVKDMTLTAQNKYNRENDKMNIARGHGVDGTEVGSWVEAQAKTRITDKGLTKPAPAEPLPPEVTQEIADARAARVKQYVADITSNKVNYYEMAKYVAINEQSERVVEQQMAEIQHGSRGRENIQAPKEQAVAPVVELSESQTRSAVAIDARAEAYKETVAEVGVENANAQLTPEVAKDWVAADANDFKQLDNEKLAIEAAAVIATTAEQVEAYSAALDNQPELVAAVATAREVDNDPVYVADPETQFESISPADAAKEDRKAADMDAITPADLAAYDALEAQQADNAAYINSQADEALAADIQQAAAELGKEPEQQREAVYEINDPRYDTTYRLDSAEKAQAKSEEIGSSRYSEINNEGERTNFVKHDGDWKTEAAVIAAQAAAMEQRREAQLAVELAAAELNKEPAPEQTAEEAAFVAKARADLGMSEQEPAAAVSAETVAQLEAADAEHDAAEIIPADWDKEPAAEIIPADWDKDQAANMIEPVTERDLAADQPAPQPVEAASLPQGNEVESDEAFTARQDKPRTPAPAEALAPQEEKPKPIVPQNISDKYEAVDNKFVNKNTKELAFEDQGNKLIVKSKENGEAVAHDLVTIAKARGWDEIKVAGTEEFRRKVWQEAAGQGIKVRGYSPSKSEEAGMQALLEKEAKEKAREQNKENSVEKQRADSFKKDSREDALKKFPELAGAYAAQAVVDKKIQADNLSPEQQAVVRARTQQNIANSIERGEVPAVKMREEVTVKREVSEEREIGR